jgi:hypothetical protein
VSANAAQPVAQARDSTGLASATRRWPNSSAMLWVDERLGKGEAMKRLYLENGKKAFRCSLPVGGV